MNCVFSRTAIAFKEEEGKRVGKRENNGKKKKGRCSLYFATDADHTGAGLLRIAYVMEYQPRTLHTVVFTSSTRDFRKSRFKNREVPSLVNWYKLNFSVTIYCPILLTKNICKTPHPVILLAYYTLQTYVRQRRKHRNQTECLVCTDHWLKTRWSVYNQAPTW